VNPNTARQVNTRSTLGYLSNRWANDLSQTQRDNWNAYAATTPWLPSVKFITGQAAYIAVSFIPVYLGGPGQENDNAPGTPLMAEHNILSYTASAAGGTLVLATPNPPLAVGDQMLFECSMVLNSGKNFWKGPFQFQGSFTDATPFPFMIHNYGGAIPAGRKAWVKTRKYSPLQNKVSPTVIQPVIFA